MKDFFSPLQDADFWLSLKPKPDVEKYLKQLIDDGHEVHIVTSTHYNSVAPKTLWILEHFPFLKWEQIIIASNKQMIKGDVLIDDYQKNLEGGDYKRILFEAYHNRFFDESTIDAVRVKTWAEIYEEINKIANS